jgi:hypothetical protein
MHALTENSPEIPVPRIARAPSAASLVAQKKYVDVDHELISAAACPAITGDSIRVKVLFHQESGPSIRPIGTMRLLIPSISGVSWQILNYSETRSSTGE